MYARCAAFPLPEEPLTRLFRAATLLREHRGDGHIAALISHGIGGTSHTSSEPSRWGYRDPTADACTIAHAAN